MSLVKAISMALFKVYPRISVHFVAMIQSYARTAMRATRCYLFFFFCILYVLGTGRSRKITVIRLNVNMALSLSVDLEAIVYYCLVSIHDARSIHKWRRIEAGLKSAGARAVSCYTTCRLRCRTETIFRIQITRVP